MRKRMNGEKCASGSVLLACQRSRDAVYAKKCMKEEQGGRKEREPRATAGTNVRVQA